MNNRNGISANPLLFVSSNCFIFLCPFQLTKTVLIHNLFYYIFLRIVLQFIQDFC